MTILRCKVAVVGDCKVGKSNLITAFHKGKQFNKNYVMTTGVDLSVKQGKIPDPAPVSGKEKEKEYSVELYLWDTSGHDLYKEMRKKFWSGTSFLMAVYDVTNRESFVSLKSWIESVKKSMPFVQSSKSSKAAASLCGVLVATKVDQMEYAQVTNAEAILFAKQHGLAFFETAAATGKDIDTPFNFLASKYFESYQNQIHAIETGSSGHTHGGNDSLDSSAIIDQEEDAF